MKQIPMNERKCASCKAKMDLCWYIGGIRLCDRCIAQLVAGYHAYHESQKKSERKKMWQLTDHGRIIGETKTLTEARQAKQEYWRQTGQWACIEPRTGDKNNG